VTRSTRAALLSVALLGVVGCSKAGEGPRPQTVEPTRGPVAEATTITIRGSGFSPAIRASYDDPASSIVSTSFNVRLHSSETSIALTDVRYIGRDELRAVVPAGHSPGRYTLEVIDPLQRMGELPEAFELLVAADAGPADAADAGPGDGPTDSSDELSVIDATPDAPTPDAPTPDTLAPDTIAPDTLAPDTLAPDTLAPDTLAPDTLAPDLFPSPTTPFSPPNKLTALSTGGDEDDPTLSVNLLELVFERGGNLYRATRGSAGAVWGSPSLLSALNSSADETTPFLTRDGLGIIFSSTRSHAQAKGNYDLYISTRASPGGAWSTPAPLVALNSNQRDLVGSMSADARTIVLSSNRSGGAGGEDIYIATRASATAGWGSPITLAGVNSSSLESVPWIDDSLTVIVFESNRGGGSGGRDLWVAERANASGPFGAPTPLAGVNTSANESDPWLSQDLKTIIFMSDRQGQQDLYQASR
jgi:hypothetical protein